MRILFDSSMLWSDKAFKNHARSSQLARDLYTSVI